MNLYNCSTKGNVEELRTLLEEKQYSVSEEVSKEGHYWTVLHYAAHYGHLNVLQFLMQFVKEKDLLHEMLNMQTVEGKTPLFCTILSGDITIPVK